MVVCDSDCPLASSCSALADWRGGPLAGARDGRASSCSPRLVPNNHRRWLIPNSQTIEVAVTFISDAIRAADLIVVDQVVIAIGAAVSSANAMINPVIVHLQHNSDEIKLSLKQTRAALVQLQATLDPDWSLADLTLDQFVNTAQWIGELST